MEVILITTLAIVVVGFSRYLIDRSDRLREEAYQAQNFMELHDHKARAKVRREAYEQELADIDAKAKVEAKMTSKTMGESMNQALTKQKEQ